MPQPERALTVLAAFFLAACGGKDDTADTTDALGSCDDYQTSRLLDVGADQWPAGFSDAVTFHKSMAGIYSATDCDGDVLEVRITTYEEGDIQVVQSGVPEGLICGCPEDPDVPVDEEMTPTGFIPRVDVFFNSGAEQYLDPSMDNETFEVQFTTFGADQEVLMRGCHTYDIDPFYESDWDRASIILRVEPDGALSGTIWFLEAKQGGAQEFCELTEWTQLTAF